jgi:hypothetical protein
MNLNTTDTDGCRARSRSSMSPTDERYNAEIDSHAYHLKNTDGFLPEMQRGTNTTDDSDKTPNDSE